MELSLGLSLSTLAARSGAPSWVLRDETGSPFDLDLDFARGRYFVGTIKSDLTTALVAAGLTLTAPGTRWATGPGGIVTPYTDGQPRIEYDTSGNRIGLRCNKADANLFTAPTDLSNAAWVKTGTTISSDVSSAPDGTMTADRINDSSTNARVTSPAVTVSTGTNYTVSFWAKRNNYDWLLLTLGEGTSTTNNVQAWFNISTGAIGSFATVGTGGSYVSHRIVPYPGGWYRIILTILTASGGICSAVLRSASGDSSLTRPDIGGGVGIGTMVNVWGLKLTPGLVAGPPVLTGPSTASSDYLSFASLFQAAAMEAAGGSLVMKYKTDQPAGASVFGYPFAVGDDAGNDRLLLRGPNASSNPLAVVGDGSGLDSLTPVTPIAQNTFGNFAFGWHPNASPGAALSVNGQTPITAARGAVADLEQAGFFGLELDGTLARMALRKRRETDAQVQSLSSSEI